MKIGRLSRATNFWRSFSFVGNTSKMRKALIAYLQDEGLKCDLSDGNVLFEYNDSFRVSTSFYFTDRTMMINLFSQHFEELTDSLSEALDIVGSKLDDQRPSQSRSIGFGADAYKPSAAESADGQAVAKA